jgi:hypothetical protein
LFVAYCEKGSKQVECSFANGVKEGDETVYFPDRTKRASLSYKNGLLEGTQKTYLPNGKKKNTYNYKAGFDTDLIGLSFEECSTKPQLLIIPSVVSPVEDKLRNSILPDFEKQDLLVKINLQFLVGVDGKVKKVIDYGTESKTNIQYFSDLLNSIMPSDTARFDDMPIECTMLLTLYFYNGMYISSCFASKPIMQLTSNYGESFWGALCYFKSSRPKNPEDAKKIRDQLALQKKTSNVPMEDKVYNEVDIMPQFPGGPEAILEFLGRTAVIPMKQQCERSKERFLLDLLLRLMVAFLELKY